MSEEFTLKLGIDAAKLRGDLAKVRKEIAEKPLTIPVRAQLDKAFSGTLGTATGASGNGNKGLTKFGTGLKLATSELGHFTAALKSAAARLSAVSASAMPAPVRAMRTAGAVSPVNGAGKTSTALMALPGAAMLAGYAMQGMNAMRAFGTGSVALYETQQGAETQFAQVLRNAGMGRTEFEDIKSHAGEIQKRTMFGDEAMIAGAGELATYVKDPESMKRMMDLLADYAAGMTGGAEVGSQQMVDLATGLGKAFDGVYDSLRKKGFDTSRLEELSKIEKDVEEAKSGNPVSAKRAAEIAASLKEFEELGGDLGKAKIDALSDALSDWDGLAESFAKTSRGAKAQINNEIGDIREEVGKSLLPAMAEVTATLQANVPAIRELFIGMGRTFASFANTAASCMPALIKVGTVLSGILSGIVSFAPALLPLVAVTKGLPMLVSGLSGLAAAIKALTIGNPIGLAVGGLFSLAIAAVKLSEKLHEARKDERRADGDKWAAEISRIKNTKWKDPNYAADVYTGETGEYRDEVFDDDGNSYGKGLRGRMKLAAVQYARANGDAIPQAWRDALDTVGVKDIRYRTGNKMHYVRTESGGDGADDAVKEIKQLQDEMLDAAKNGTVNYTYAPNIRQTNNISTQFDELGKLVNENIRELATSRLTFRTAAEAAKAVAL